MKKIKLPPITTRGEAESTVRHLQNVTIALRREIDLRDSIIAECTKDSDAKIAVYEKVIKGDTQHLADWASRNPSEFPKDRKSIEFASGIIGFRTGTPALALLNKKWSWAKVLTAVQEKLPNFIRSKPEVDKEAIISQREELDIFLPDIGVKVVQGETFYVEPALTKVPTRQTVEA